MDALTGAEVIDSNKCFVILGMRKVNAHDAQSFVRELLEHVQLVGHGTNSSHDFGHGKLRTARILVQFRRGRKVAGRRLNGTEGQTTQHDGRINVWTTWRLGLWGMYWCLGDHQPLYSDDYDLSLYI